MGKPDRLYVFSLADVTAALAGSVGEPGAADATLEWAENGVVLRLRFGDAVAHPGPVSPTTLPLMDVQDDSEEMETEDECSARVVREEMAAAGHPSLELDRLDTYLTEKPEALYQSLRARIDPPDHSPTLQQIRAWTPEQLGEVARWVAVEHAHDHPIAGLPLPERFDKPVPLAQAIIDRIAEMARMGKTPKKRGAKK